jgi:hypothetical protein
MNERESDPTGAFRGGSAGLEDDPTTGTEFERHAPDGAQPGGGQPNDGRPATDDGRDTNQAPQVDETERDVITSGTAATSEVADPAAQADAERHGDGTPLPR